jgi:hypothetical protein
MPPMLRPSTGPGRVPSSIRREPRCSWVTPMRLGDGPTARLRTTEPSYLMAHDPDWEKAAEAILAHAACCRRPGPPPHYTRPENSETPSRIWRSRDILQDFRPYPQPKDLRQATAGAVQERWTVFNPTLFSLGVCVPWQRYALIGLTAEKIIRTSLSAWPSLPAGTPSSGCGTRSLEAYLSLPCCSGALKLETDRPRAHDLLAALALADIIGEFVVRGPWPSPSRCRSRLPSFFSSSRSATGAGVRHDHSPAARLDRPLPAEVSGLARY